MKLTIIAIILCVSLGAKAQQDSTEMKKAIDAMQKMYSVHFVYDSSLANIKPKGIFQRSSSLPENLKRIFSGTGIRWEIQGEYVLLFRQNNYTFSGHICEDNGETLINVTIFDLNTQTGTLSNEQGFFSITLPEGKHKLRFSYIGYQDVVKEVDLTSNYNGVIYLKESNTSLKEVVVVADLNASLRTTQTGKVSLTSEQLNTEFSLLSSPDLVKTLQNIPGVASGTELLSGMYVHGGKNDENLFLLDGTPLYQINHLGGLFSAFNTDIIKNVDFYKSGFPARYGGRLSSVVDVRTKEGNMKEFHGTFSLGLLDGRVQFEGPIIKDKTSFNIAMRRSWADLFTAPAFFLLNRSNPDDKKNVRYAFHDNSKRHFKEPRKVNYAGWIPSENVLMYDHARINPRNNQPIRYRIGINSINKLFDIHQFFNGDTLKIYGEPFLKTTTDAVVVSGEVVYLYKLDKSGKSALISNVPALSDSTKRFLGWVPADLLAEVGQNEVYHIDYSRYRDSLLCAVNLMYPDTLALHNANIQGTMLFNLDGNPAGPITNGNIRLNYPLSVWDKNWNKIINIKGGDIMVSDVRKMEAENKNVNIHVLFNDADLPYLSPYINVLQNLKLKMKPGYDYTFSATCISSNGENRHLAPTKDFSAWLDYIKQSISSKRKNEQEEQSSFYGFGGAIKQISRYDDESRFSNNVFVILGSKQTLSLHEQQLSWLATQPARLLFAQIDRASGTSYQDFLLQAKSILDSHSTKYIDHISNYIADSRLVKTELFKNIEATDANLYLYDAPYNSLTVGGILFPKGRNRLESNALETALDSVLWQSFETDSLLLHSLKDYERNIGVLRSRPTSELTHIFHHTENPDSMSLDDIDRNSVNDTYYIKASVADSIMDGYEYGYLLDDKEVMELLQSYRGLLPEFSDNIGKKELRVLRKQFNRQKKSINRSFYRKVLPRNPYLAQIFYCKTGVMANDSLLNSTKVKKLKKRKVELTDFNSGYTALISKMKRLEDMYQRNLFRPVFIAGKKYYFIPKQLIL